MPNRARLAEAVAARAAVEFWPTFERRWLDRRRRGTTGTSMRCRAHDLALGPDGQCVLCRRRRLRAQLRITPRIALALGAGGLLALAALGVGIRRLSSADVPVQAESSSAVAEAESEELSEEPSEPRRAIETSSPEPRLAADTPRPEASTAAVPSDAASPAEPDAASAARAPTPEQIRTALRETPVVMYTTKWCASCEKARAFFKANGVPFEERDVEASERNRADLLRLSGANSVPLIDVDGKKLTGFGEQSVTEALRDSVERRLGVNSLKIQRR